jgi:hypothetical protein
LQITSYGLFWRAAEIDWFPGKGNRKEFRLLGRIGSNFPKVRLADFRRQQGIYILYDEYGPAYVGLARGDRLGARLREHHEDKHAEKWDRFSWFGFNPIGSNRDEEGVLLLEEPRSDPTEDTTTTIRDLEALLIRAMGPKLNTNIMNFKNAERWEQVASEEWEERFKHKVKP